MRSINIFKIMINDIKRNLRNTKAMMMMVLFPIVLMSILGMSLSGIFEGTKINLNTKVIYTETWNGNLQKSFEEFAGSLKDIGVKFEKGNSEEEGIASIKNTTYSAYIKIDENANKLVIYKNDRYNFSAGLIESALSSFVEKYNLYYEVGKVNPTALNEIMNSNGKSDLVKTVGLERKREPKAKDYYAITMLTLIIMYGAMTASYAITNEKIRKTYLRVIGTPTKRQEYFIGKLLGSVAVTSLQIIVVILFSKYVLKAYLGDNILIFGAIILSEIIMAVSVGQGAAYLMKNEAAVSGLLNGIIPFIVLLGGGYFPLDQFGSNILTTISKISPIKWVNESLFKVIYSNDFSKVAPAIIINLSVAIVFIMLSSFKYRGEAEA